MSEIHTAPRSVIVVDDPHGYVVPSLGVEIIGRTAHRHELMKSVYDRVLVQTPEGAPVMTIRKRIEPRRQARAPKQRLKGLRP